MSEDTINLEDKNLLLMLAPSPFMDEARTQIRWASKCFDNIYLVSVKYLDGLAHGCIALWYVEIKDGKFNFIVPMTHKSVECLAIDYKWEEEKQKCQVL